MNYVIKICFIYRQRHGTIQKMVAFLKHTSYSQVINRNLWRRIEWHLIACSWADGLCNGKKNSHFFVVWEICKSEGWNQLDSPNTSFILLEYFPVQNTIEAARNDLRACKAAKSRTNETISRYLYCSLSIINHYSTYSKRNMLNYLFNGKARKEFIVLECCQSNTLYLQNHRLDYSKKGGNWYVLHR